MFELVQLRRFTNKSPIVYTTLGIHWASSLLGFIALALIPIPWVLFKFGPRIRAKSKFETHKYE